MRGRWLRWLAVLLLGTLGCRSGTPELKPTTQPEVLRLPPADEARYNYPTMPKEALGTTRDPSRKNPDPLAPPRTPYGPGGRPAMGAGGM